MDGFACRLSICKRSNKMKICPYCNEEIELICNTCNLSWGTTGNIFYWQEQIKKGRGVEGRWYFVPIGCLVVKEIKL